MDSINKDIEVYKTRPNTFNKTDNCLAPKFKAKRYMKCDISIP